MTTPDEPAVTVGAGPPRLSGAVAVQGALYSGRRCAQAAITIRP